MVELDIREIFEFWKRAQNLSGVHSKMPPGLCLTSARQRSAGRAGSPKFVSQRTLQQGEFVMDERGCFAREKLHRCQPGKYRDGVVLNHDRAFSTELDVGEEPLPDARPGFQDLDLPGLVILVGGHSRLPGRGFLEKDFKGRPVVNAVEMRPGGIDESVDASPERRRFPDVFEGLHEPFGKAIEGIFQNRGQDAVLATEMMLDCAPGQARAARDFGRGRSLEPDFTDALDGCCDDPRAGLSRPFDLGSTGSSLFGQIEELHSTHFDRRYHTCIARTM